MKKFLFLSLIFLGISMTASAQTRDNLKPGITAKDYLKKHNVQELALSQSIKRGAEDLAQIPKDNLVILEKSVSGTNSTMFVVSNKQEELLFIGFSPSIPSSMSTLSLSAAEARGCKYRKAGRTMNYNDCIRAETNDKNNSSDY